MLEIIKKACVKTFDGTIWKFFFSTIGSAFTTILAARNIDLIFHTVKPLSLSISIVIGLCTFLICYIGRFIYYYWKIYTEENAIKNKAESDKKIADEKALAESMLNKKDIYGEAIILLQEAFANFHQLRRLNSKENEYKLMLRKAMQVLCDKIKKIYDVKTISNCSVSLKTVIADNYKQITAISKVTNVSRDSGDSSRSRENNLAYTNNIHNIFNNTCFNSIFSKLPDKNAYYCNNNIPNTSDYLNTSKKCYTNGILPYKSEIVVPIIPLYTDETNVYSLVGFLCVDSDKENVFDEKYDIAIIKGVADGIYDIFQDNFFIPLAETPQPPPPPQKKGTKNAKPRFSQK